ncbi:MAG TPA: YdaS family helix-turn-helix protein [Variovorax sp.]|nr:YdaS family helix-turn-helix protein [Variovorax sp.]
MQDLKRLNLLIDKARDIAGSDAKLADMLGVRAQHVSNWRHGHRTPGQELQERMAKIAGIDPAPHVAAAAIEKTGHPGALALLAGLRKQWHFS